MLVFKRVRGKGKACGDACLKMKKQGIRGCALKAQKGDLGDFAQKKETIGCKVCGKFVDMWIDDLEKAVPELRAEENREVGEIDSGYSSMCES